MAADAVAGHPPPVPLTPEPAELDEHRPGGTGEFQVEISANCAGDMQVFTVSGRWREKGGGRLETELHGVATAADGSGELPLTGSVALHVQRILGVPVQIRRIELDLEFGDSHLWVRHTPNFGIQLLGLDIPGILTVTAADGVLREKVDVRIKPGQIATVARDITLARPDPG